MTNARYPAAALAVLVLGSALPAAAGEYARMFFVKPGATALAMFDDRDACAARADALDVEQAGNYSDPEFGSLAAMAAALQQDDQAGGGKLRATVRRVALERCMERRGWTLLEPGPEDSKAIRKASRKRPEALDAWLKTHESKAPPPAAQAASPPAPSGG